MKHPGSLWGMCGVLRAQIGPRVRPSSSRMECAILAALALPRETLQRKRKIIQREFFLKQLKRSRAWRQQENGCRDHGTWM